jgi:hypothetical protein
MSDMWQYIGVAVAIALAAGYLTVHYIRRRKTGVGCRACRLMQAVRPQPPLQKLSSKQSLSKQ